MEGNESLLHGGCQKLDYDWEEVYLSHRVSTRPGTRHCLPAFPPLPSSCTKGVNTATEPLGHSSTISSHVAGAFEAGPDVPLMSRQVLGLPAAGH